MIEPDKREWDPEKLESLQAQSRQLQLFKTIEEIEEEYRVVKKIPYKFSYTFLDDEGKRSKLMIEDWEIGMLYLNCLCRAKNNEDIAVQKVKEKYYNEFLEKDLYFFSWYNNAISLKIPKSFYNCWRLLPTAFYWLSTDEPTRPYIVKNYQHIFICNNSTEDI